MSAEGMILRTRMGDIREIGRNAQGVRLIDLPNEDRVVGVAKLAETDAIDPSGPDNPNGDLPDGNGDIPVEPDSSPD
jgi:DNA gyrase subunit A